MIIMPLPITTPSSCSAASSSSAHQYNTEIPAFRHPAGDDPTLPFEHDEEGGIEHSQFALTLPSSVEEESPSSYESSTHLVEEGVRILIRDGAYIKPKRVLTAYNIFFQDERRKMLEDRDEALLNASRDHEQPAIQKIGFAAMARTVSARWKLIDEATRQHYLELSAQDKIRYTREMKVWKRLEKEMERQMKKHQLQSQEEEDGKEDNDEKPKKKRKKRSKKKTTKKALSLEEDTPKRTAEETNPKSKEGVAAEDDSSTPMQNVVSSAGGQSNQDASLYSFSQEAAATVTPTAFWPSSSNCDGGVFAPAVPQDFSPMAICSSPFAENKMISPAMINTGSTSTSSSPFSLNRLVGGNNYFHGLAPQQTNQQQLLTAFHSQQANSTSCGGIPPQMNGGQFLSRSSLSFFPSFLSSGQENSPSSSSVSPPLMDILQRANELAATLDSDGDFFSSTNGTKRTASTHASAHQAFLDSNSPASIHMACNHLDEGEDDIIPEADLAMVTTYEMLPFDSNREGGLCSLEMNQVVVGVMDDALEGAAKE